VALPSRRVPSPSNPAAVPSMDYVDNADLRKAMFMASSTFRTRHDLKKALLMAGFSFVNGWVDALCLIRYRAFATMMVGNMLTFGHVAVSFFIAEEGETASHLPNPLFYVFLVVLFMMGVSSYRILERWRGWSGKHFAPLVVAWIVVHDLLEGSAYEFLTSGWTVLRLAPVFGMQDAMTVRNGFGSLPWCTTNNVVTMAFASTDLIMGRFSMPIEEWRKLVTSCIMFAAMILGTVGGAAYNALAPDELHEMEMAVIAPWFGLLFLLNDWVFPPATDVTARLSEGLLLTG